MMRKITKLNFIIVLMLTSTLLPFSSFHTQGGLNQLFISNPSDFSFFDDSLGYSILWTVSGINPDNYTVYQNGVVNKSGMWANGSIFVMLDGLQTGNYNFTCIIADTIGSTLSDEVWVTVVLTTPDSTPPTISNPTNISFEEGSWGYELRWSGFDLNPWWATVTRNGTLVYDNAWIGNDIILSLDNLLLGLYIFNCTLYDSSDNYISDISEVDVTNPVPDTIAPLISPPISIQYIEGTVGNNLSWICLDMHPFAYFIYINDSLLISNPWHGENITHSIDGLTEGLWIVNLTLWDLSNNHSSNTVNVQVIHATDNSPPIISHPEDIATTISRSTAITWIVSDNYPANYIIYKNGTIFVQSETWETGLIQLNLHDLTLGNWFINLTIWDKGGNSDSSVVKVTVYPDDFDIDPPSISHVQDFQITVGSKGNFGFFYLYDAHPLVYNVSINNIFVTENVWVTPNLRVNISLDELAVGEYTVVLSAWDIIGNSNTRSFSVTVEGDNQPPTISSPPDIITTSGKEIMITWDTYDESPEKYEIYLYSEQNETLLKKGQWNSGTISYQATYTEGEYLIRCMVNDSEGNIAFDDVFLVSQKGPSGFSPGFEMFPFLFVILLFVLNRQFLTSNRRRK